MLYHVAAFTRIRVGELAELTPAHFDLDHAPPIVTVEAKDAKRKREEPIHLPAHLAALLRPWLATRPKTALLWPGQWAAHLHQVDWLAADVKRAGITETDAKGRRITFHSLKHRYVVSVIKAGADIHEARRLARH